MRRISQIGETVMGERVLLLVGTRKGVFILESDGARRSWRQRGPYCATWPMNHVMADPRTGTIYGGGGNEWFGPAVWQSSDLGLSWTHSSDGLAYPEGETPIRSAWSIAASGDTVYAGVEPAGLFRSDDRGQSWRHVAGLRDHPSRPEWQPGGGGLILHSLVTHPADPQQLWVGISTGGVFHTCDGGVTWEARNRGTRCDFLPEEQRYPETGQCVHHLTMAPGHARPALSAEPLRDVPQRGRRPRGGRASRRACRRPSAFPRRPILAIPTHSSSCRSTATRPAATRPRPAPPSGGPATPAGAGATCGKACRSGTPTSPCSARPWRPTRLEPAGVYFGTNTGSLFASGDEGDSWACVAQHLPTILSVETLVVSGVTPVTVSLPAALVQLFPGARAPARARGCHRG